MAAGPCAPRLRPRTNLDADALAADDEHVGLAHLFHGLGAEHVAAAGLPPGVLGGRGEDAAVGEYAATPAAPLC